MLDLLLAPVIPWLLLVAAAGLPFLLSVVGLVLHHGTDGRHRGSALPLGAGPWLEEKIGQDRIAVRVEIHPRDGLDAYWPSVGAIGLSQRTWAGRHAGHWAIAAHELGHALNMASHPFVAQLLPIARLAQQLTWRAFTATLFCALLLGHPALWTLGYALLVLAVLATAVVCLDEVGASLHGHRMLSADPRVDAEALEIARVSMMGAGSAYGLGFVGQLIVFATWPWLAESLMAGVGSATVEPGPLVMWLTLFLLPVLLLRAAHVLIQVMQPEPVRSDFRLFSVMQRDAQWEFLTGIGALVLVVGLHPLLSGAWAALALVLATMTAIGPVSALARAVLLLPVLLVLRWTQSEKRRKANDTFFPTPTLTGEAAPALMALYSNPPWYLRATWLTHLAYLPLLGVLALRFLA